jgi:hypothetical protein
MVYNVHFFCRISRKARRTKESVEVCFFLLFIHPAPLFAHEMAIKAQTAKIDYQFAPQKLRVGSLNT